MKIKSLSWRIRSVPKRKALHISEVMRNNGLSSAIEAGTSIDLGGVFKNKNKAVIQDWIKKICRKYDMPVDMAVVRRLVVSLNGYTLTLLATVKELENPPSKKERRLKMLGAVGKYGDGANNLFSKLGASTYQCKMLNTVKRVAICSKQ